MTKSRGGWSKISKTQIWVSRRLIRTRQWTRVVRNPGETAKQRYLRVINRIKTAGWRFKLEYSRRWLPAAGQILICVAVLEKFVVVGAETVRTVAYCGVFKTNFRQRGRICILGRLPLFERVATTACAYLITKKKKSLISFIDRRDYSRR